jgi:ABC-type glycerol-3-phosphate transport system substrate-binding protein
VLRAGGGLAGGGIAALAAACGPAGGAAAPPAGGVTKQPLELFMFNQENGQEFIDQWRQMLRPFTEKYPNVTFNVDGAPAGPLSLLDKALAMGAAGTPPHFTYSVTRNGPTLYSSGLTQDMNNVVKRERLDLKDVAKAVLENFDWRGALLALPYDPGYAFVQYNRDLFERAGLPDPGRLWQEKKWDWNVFVQSATTLTRTPGGEQPQWGYQVQLWEGDYLSVIRGFGANELNQDRTKFVLDDGAGVAAVDTWCQLCSRFKVSPLPGQGPAKAMASGQLAMLTNHPGAIRSVQKDVRDSGRPLTWDVVPHPAPTGKQPVPVLFTNGLYLWKGIKDEATTVEVLKFLMSDQSMLQWGSLTGRDPARTTLIDQHIKNLGIPADHPRSWPQVYKELTPLVRGVQWTVAYVEWHSMVYDQVLTPVLKGEKSAQDALQNAAPAINAVLQRAAPK